MEIIQLNETKESFPPTVIGLGNFDGVHLGHVSLIKDAVRLANREGYLSSLLLFRSHTGEVLKSKKTGRYLTSNTQKANVFRSCNLDRIYVQAFDESFAKTSPEDFVVELLQKRLNVKAIVVGINYTFGYKAMGNIELLQSLTKKAGIELLITPPVYYRDAMISSTLIRNIIEKGDIENANKLLSRPYAIKGKVTSGSKRGRDLGFPTANTAVEFDYLYPKDGVYLTQVKLEDKLHYALTNVGTNPTFTESKHKKIENHILNFQGDIYGREIEIFFLDYLRGDFKFASAQELIAQMHKDKATAQGIINHLQRDKKVIV